MSQPESKELSLGTEAHRRAGNTPTPPMSGSDTSPSSFLSVFKVKICREILIKFEHARCC